jgi:hypothetical protein
MATLLGLGAKAFINDGSYGTPAWEEIDSIVNLSLEIEVNEVDASRRGSGGWRQNETTLRDATLNLTMIKDKEDTGFTDLEDEFHANTAFELAVLDGANASGTDWLTARWKIQQWNETQDLEGVITIEAVLRPAPATTAIPLNPTFGTGTLPTTRS